MAEGSMTGRMLGRYHVLEKVGEGGMGVVYRAEDTRLNRVVALKLIHPTLLEDEEARARFLREAQAVSGITHPNVCTIHSIEEEGGQLFLVLEFLEGRHLKESGAELRQDPKTLLDTLIQSAEGLAEAGRCQVVHRDIKSSNIWVTVRGLVKLVDFGLAKHLAAKPASDVTADVTQKGVTVGTTHYMSPEQARAREVDPRSDLFSYGVVMYEASTGKLPFTGTNTVEVFDQILNAEPLPPSQAGATLGPEFDRIVQKCLRKDPAERYQAGADLVVDLKSLKRAMESGARTPLPGSIPAASQACMPAAGSGCGPAAPPTSHLRSAILLLVALGVLVGLTLLVVTVLSGKKASVSRDSGPARPAVVVLAFENRTGDTKMNWYGANAAELLAVELAKLPNVDVISKQRLFDALKELHKDATQVDAAVATEVAKRANATLMVRGDTLMVGEAVLLTAEVLDVSSGRVIAAERVTGVTQQNLLEKVDELGNLLREKLKAVK
jgi:TolB-like protein/tRNA A-37 threonylcarbamoyl transferase component Bud32